MPKVTLQQLFANEIRNIMGADRQRLKGLKKLKTSAKGNKLQDAFDQHHVQTEGHIERLKEVFSFLDMSVRGKKCKAMEGLLNETAEIIEDFQDFQDSPDILDTERIAAAQKVEHDEMASVWLPSD